MEKIDKRKKYYLVVDVETANSTEDALVYDIGFAVSDKKGNIYEKHSYIIYDIFVGEKELMKSAYYAEKIPRYEQGLKAGNFKMVAFMTAYKIIRDVLKKYKIKNVCAYNANFDRNALNTTLRFLTKSKMRYFFPYGTKILCIWSMACDTIYQQKSFIRQALQNNWLSEKGNIQTSAEIGYRYMTGDKIFEEEHTGLKDVEIECQIMARCFKQNKKMNKNINRSCWRKPTQKMKELDF